jgi:protease-4
MRTRRRWPWWVFGITVVLVVFGCVWASVAAVIADGAGGLGDGDTIAVIPMTGTISGSGGGSGAINPQSFLKQLRRAEGDSKVKAIVLRIDSPGGTVAASEEIASYVQHAKKPVVVSVADMDASGAYMVSARADRIVANPGSSIGSIGVIMEIPNASKLMDKLGLEFKVITAGKYKDAGSPFRAVTPAESAMLQTQINEIYGQFIDIVAEGRDLPRSEVESMATGWAWTGTEAKKMGLIDKVGTYEDALHVAADLGKIKGGYRTDVYDENELSDILNAVLGVESMLQKMTASTTGGAGSVQGTNLPR